MTPPFVKKYDFRGIYGTDLKNRDAYYLAKALRKVMPVQKVLVGWDTRVSSKRLALDFISGIGDVTVSYIDFCPIDYITAASYACDFDISIMFTGSHNPWSWTGLLMHTKGGDSVQGELVDKIIAAYYEVEKEPYLREEPDLSRLQNFKEEIEEIVGKRIGELLPLKNITPMEVLVDIGDGSGTTSINLLERLIPQIRFTKINDRRLYDANSPHTADPSIEKNMEQLIEQMHSGFFSCGFAFDSDADRILAVDETGEYLTGSLLGSAHVEVLANLSMPGKNIGYALDCGPSLPNAISQINTGSGKDFSAVPIPVGRSVARQMLRQNGLDLGVENVGHFYYKDFFMTDSGIFSLVVLLYWVSINGKLSAIKTKYPDGFKKNVNTMELDNRVVSELTAYFDYVFKDCQKKSFDLDGQRCEFYRENKIFGWYAIRHSGFENLIRFYFGCLDQPVYKMLEERFNTVVKIT
ncbi:MAG: hypothetical protein ACM3IJ_00115 [Candidatus Levyibacteriota bacterium]